MRGPPRTKPHPTWPYWEASASWFMALHEYEPDGIICLMEEPQLRLLNKVSLNGEPVLADTLFWLTG